VRSGRLRHRITIKQDAGTADAAGQVVESWSAFRASVPAEVIETGGREALFGQAIDATATHMIIIRYDSSVTEQMQVTWGTRTLGIINARDKDGRRKEMWLTCRELKP